MLQASLLNTRVAVAFLQRPGKINASDRAKTSGRNCLLSGVGLNFRCGVRRRQNARARGKSRRGELHEAFEVVGREPSLGVGRLRTPRGNRPARHQRHHQHPARPAPRARRPSAPVAQPASHHVAPVSRPVARSAAPAVEAPAPEASPVENVIDSRPASNTHIDAQQIQRTGSAQAGETLSASRRASRWNPPRAIRFPRISNIAASWPRRSRARRKASPSIRTACASTRRSATR